MASKYATVRELKRSSSHRKVAQAMNIARDSKTGQFVSTGHRWEIKGGDHNETIVVSTSASSSSAIETIVKKNKKALIRLADK